MKTKEIKGITLIALVITVIVLLILAGVTIGAITGNNGIIGQANDAKLQTEIAEEKEILGVATVNAMGKDKEGNVIKINLDGELDKNPGKENYSSEEKEEGIIVTFKTSQRKYLVETNGNITEYKESVVIDKELPIEVSNTTEAITITVKEEELEDKNLEYKYYINGQGTNKMKETTYTQNVTLESKDPYIPNNFKHTEGEVNTGYVIRDTNLGNEFVWVPVKSGSFEVYVEATNSNNEVMKSETKTIEVSELTRDVKGQEANFYDRWGNEIEGDINDKKSIAYFKKSVVENGGFYMGRYEMGMPGQTSGAKPVLSNSREARNIKGVPVCKANVMPWNYIDWSQAKENLESMYNSDVQSAMLNSYARTTTLNWFMDTGILTFSELSASQSYGVYDPTREDVTVIFKGYCYGMSNSDYSTAGLAYYSDYTSISDLSMEGNAIFLIATGATTNPIKRNALNNIYDLAGNSGEWITEKANGSENHRISGGSFTDYSFAYPLMDGVGFSHSGTTGDINISSRPILYK